ncbi:hypothetical protein LBBP_04122 [Leptospira borgpetersenii serovar Ballum]|uniref:Uncharacterized protein n=1 Tax=Leptospira borgpetersenii serovar Ballum TaxID=280505 RepID=A0A0S2IX87_LEPBO|nr:hypothetical protein LBBP_04122 [Leptospira borgpetersenii serovar Ballum]
MFIRWVCFLFPAPPKRDKFQKFYFAFLRNETKVDSLIYFS